MTRIKPGTRNGRKAPTAPPGTGLAAQMQARSEAAAELLKAMANPQRLRVLCLLIEREMSVGELNALVPLSQSALSQHLAVLRVKKPDKTRRAAPHVYQLLSEGSDPRGIENLHTHTR